MSCFMKHIVMLIKLISILALLSIFSSAQAEDPIDKFLGRWQSDEEKTLEDMQRHPDIPKQSRQYLEKNLFGQLILIIRKNESASYFPEDENSKIAEFEPHTVTEVGDNYVVFQGYDLLLGKERQTKFYYEDGYIFTYVTKWNFKEYFHRLD